MTAALVTFTASFCGIVALLALRAWEERRGARVALDARRRADELALALKQALMALGEWLAHAPPRALALLRELFALLVRAFAHLAQAASGQAHRLADLVSYKRSFTPAEPRSEFLMQVGERPTIATEPPKEKRVRRARKSAEQNGETL
ncbi:hypothetical protein COU20_00700 [Candidatus Kaiserbacteria bacterium CG10_big_fil_rev_8_21_14_0_10_59_10]|uniref:Uncharacterized protein n=1 Tax=Candidatus Kaiserbacteria bacterium CG10_big_fil_rev_8_21_14_0_10_59_10 TaxID=1974612 RepID=A0A2H0UAF3_9BACT|nr:MAG: hypothetical protein COU20_00700 [Candidatus Kaiserbacteria bacterium CG10_big_fil_rev_8_21_14_0_10_59_10]